MFKPKASLPLFALILLSALVMGCTSKSTPPENTAQTSSLTAIELTPGSIDPGVGIKEIKLGQTRAEIEPVLGVPTGHDRNEFVEGQTFLLYHKAGIELTLQDDRVEMINLHSKNKEWTAYTGATADGIGVTSTAKEITDSLGEAPESAPRAFKYPALGIVFRFDQDREGDGSNARAETVSIVPPQK